MLLEVNACITKLLMSNRCGKARNPSLYVPGAFSMIINVLLTVDSYKIVTRFKKILLQC